MPAWKVTKLWTDKEIGEYRDYVAEEGPNMARGGRVCTCEDLAIDLVSDFAYENGLPVKFVNGANPLPKGITPESYMTRTDFLQQAKKTTGASDLEYKRNVEKVRGAADGDSTSLRAAKPGDLILLYNPVSHTQVVAAAGSSKVVIVQGNLSGWPYKSSDPYKGLYAGARVRIKSYDLDNKSGKWLYDDEELFREGPGRLRRWPFEWWNTWVEPYYVRNGDTTRTIARYVYGNVTPDALNGVDNAVDGRVDSNGNPLVGLVLYFWQ